MDIRNIYKHLTVQQQAILFAMYRKKPESLISYKKDKTRRVSCIESLEHFMDLILWYKANPKETWAYARNALLWIMRDSRLKGEEKYARLCRYLEAAIGLQVILDTLAFPEFEVPRLNLPSYIPHGLVDMGKDSELNPLMRGSREKIEVDKLQILHRPEFLTFLEQFLKTHTPEDFQSSQGAKFKAGHELAVKIPRVMSGGVDETLVPARTLKLNEFIVTRTAECRHHALVFAVLMEFLAIEVRVWKCWLTGDAHAVNLFREYNRWYLVDVSVPHESGEPYIYELKNISLINEFNSVILPHGRYYIKNTQGYYYIKSLE